MVDYGSVLKHPFEAKEMPQYYDQFTSAFVHKTPRAHTLGLVGGNDVSLIKGNMVDLESDLRGITRPNTRDLGNGRVHKPLHLLDKTITRTTPKETQYIQRAAKCCLTSSRFTTLFWRRCS